MVEFTEEPLRDRGACFLRFHGRIAVGATLSNVCQAPSRPSWGTMGARGSTSGPETAA
jgi:hypothetical protein